MAERKTSILDLPDLPMTKIFSLLSMRDRLWAEFVCRRWNRLAKDKASWSNFHALRNDELFELIGTNYYSYPSLMRQLFSRFAIFINELEFNIMKSLNGKYLSAILQQIECNQIRHLKLALMDNSYEHEHYEHSQILLRFANKMPELRTLVIEGKVEQHDLEWLKMFALHSTKLELLHLDSMAETFAPNLAGSGFVFPASLKNIKLGREEAGIMGLIMNLQPEQNNHLGYLLPKIAQQCPNLESLEADRCNLDFDVAIQLASRIHHLCCPSIEGQRWAANHSQLILALPDNQHHRHHFENIRILEFGTLSEQELVLIGKRCPHLEHMTIHNFKETTQILLLNEDGASVASFLSDQIEELGVAFINVKSLELGNKNSTRYLRPLFENGNFINLEWINLPRDYIQLAEDVISMMENCPKLSHLAAYSITIEAICEIIKRKKNCQLRQLRVNRPIWDRDLSEICKILEDFYKETETPNNEDHPGIVRICCLRAGATPSWTFDDVLNPWLRVYDNSQKPWPFASVLKQARFGGLSEIPSFLEN